MAVWDVDNVPSTEENDSTKVCSSVLACLHKHVARLVNIEFNNRLLCSLRSWQEYSGLQCARISLTPRLLLTKALRSGITIGAQVHPLKHVR